MLIEKISEKEHDLIYSLRDTVFSRNDFSRGTLCDNEKFLHYWETSKMHLSTPFKDGLILKKHINVSAPDAEKRNAMNSFVHCAEDCCRLRLNIQRALEMALGNEYYQMRASDDNSIFSRVYSINEIFDYFIFTTHSFMNNLYEGPTFSIEIEGQKPIKFIEGMKVMRLLKKLAEFANETETFERVRIEQSKIVNDNKLSTDLCLSIHPLDYMTASYNKNDWTSCMDWMDGEFRRGVVEMMNSPYVVVAYIPSDKNTILNGDWNSKRWREFFIVSKECISGIKGYPYWDRALEKIVLNWLKELYSPVFNVKYGDMLTWSPENTQIRMHCGPAMYNDFYSDNEYNSYFSIDPEDFEELFYSGVSECIVCGEQGYFEEEGHLCCAGCVETFYCADCGTLITSEEELYEHNGQYYCSYCFDNLPICDYCGAKVESHEEYESFFIAAKLDNCTVIPIQSYGTPRNFYIEDSCLYNELLKSSSYDFKWCDGNYFYGNYIDIRNFKKDALLSMVSKEELEDLYKRINNECKTTF